MGEGEGGGRRERRGEKDERRVDEGGVEGNVSVNTG